MTEFVQPFQLKDGDTVLFEGTHYACMSKKGMGNGKLTVEPNPEFGWIEVEVEEDG